jgi:hypothetical protein
MVVDRNGLQQQLHVSLTQLRRTFCEAARVSIDRAFSFSGETSCRPVCRLSLQADDVPLQLGLRQGSPNSGASGYKAPLSTKPNSLETARQATSDAVKTL